MIAEGRIREFGGQVVIVAIALLLALMFATVGAMRSRATRAQTRAQLISNFAALVQSHPVSADTNVVSLDAYRARRITASRASSRVAYAKHSQRATR
jgi:hypothetical protein